MIERDWRGLYCEGWTGLIAPEAFAHPAKFSRGLIRRIYQHAIAQGWLQAGQVVADPFGGVALGALHAMQNGLHWIGIELEEKFVALAQQNIDLWNARYAAHLPTWGSAAILQGDSRQLCEVVKGATGVVGSPPFGNSDMRKGGSDLLRTNRLQTGRNPDAPGSISNTTTVPYGNSEYNLGNFPAREGDFDAAMGSPPYVRHGTGHDGACIRLNDAEDARREAEGCRRRPAYGEAIGQLAALPEGDPREVIDGVCGSPPFQGSMAQAHGGGCLAAENDERYAGLGIVKWKHRQSDYGNTDGQLGQSSGDTFWSASRQIMQQVYAILKPGGVAIWVCKRFVRNKQIVEFSQQWAQLGIACGFEPLEWIRAWLVEDRGAQFALNGDLVKRRVERKSFFRRLAESKGSPRIDWEDVIVQRKPAIG